MSDASAVAITIEPDGLRWEEAVLRHAKMSEIDGRRLAAVCVPWAFAKSLHQNLTRTMSRYGSLVLSGPDGDIAVFVSTTDHRMTGFEVPR